MLPESMQAQTAILGSFHEVCADHSCVAAAEIHHDRRALLIRAGASEDPAYAHRSILCSATSFSGGFAIAPSFTQGFWICINRAK